MLSVLMAVTVGTTSVEATASNDDTLKKVNPTSARKLLTKDVEKDFSRFAEQKAAKLVQYNEYRNVMQVVALFNQAPAQFLKLNAAQQDEFRGQVAKLDARLSRVRGAEAQAWRQTLSNTAHTMNYLWKHATAEPLVDPMEVQIW